MSVLLQVTDVTKIYENQPKPGLDGVSFKVLVRNPQTVLIRQVLLEKLLDAAISRIRGKPEKDAIYQDRLRYGIYVGWRTEIMNSGTFSIHRSCVAVAAFFSVISAAAIAAAYFLTRNPAVVWLELLFSALVSLCSAAFAAFLHRKLVLFSDSLFQAINDILDGAAAPLVTYEDETLFCKINHRLARLYEVMRENRQGMIFKRFYREESVHAVDGIGIGLYLAREIVAMQCGYIKVVSTVGHGSTFSVFLPCR